MQKKINNTTLDLLICTGIYAALAAFYTQLMKIPKDVRGYPAFLMAGACLFNTILLIQTIGKMRKERADGESSGVAGDVFRSNFIKIVTYVVIFAAYIFLIPKVGYILATFLFLLGMLLYIGVRDVKAIVLLPLLMTAVIYALFTYVLVVILPKGTWITLPF